MTLLSEEAASLELNVSLRKLRQWRAMGEGPQAVRIGRKFCYRQNDIENWINGQIVRDPLRTPGYQGDQIQAFWGLAENADEPCHWFRAKAGQVDILENAEGCLCIVMHFDDGTSILIDDAIMRETEGVLEGRGLIEIRQAKGTRNDPQ